MDLKISSMCLTWCFVPVNSFKKEKRQMGLWSFLLYRRVRRTVWLRLCFLSQIKGESRVERLFLLVFLLRARWHSCSLSLLGELAAVFKNCQTELLLCFISTRQVKSIKQGSSTRLTAEASSLLVSCTLNGIVF